MKSKDKKVTTSSESKEKVDQDIEAKIKKDDGDKLNDDGKSEKNNESMSRPSSKQGKNQHMGTEAKPEHDPITRHEDEPVKLFGKASLLRAQQDPAEHRQLLQELKLEQAIVISSEIKKPRDNSVGEHVETIYKEDAVCKKCCKYMFHENIVLWAKCKCKLALIHEKCATEWFDENGSTCGVCGEEIKNVSVTLTVDASTSSPQQSAADQLGKPTSVPKKRFWSLF